MSITKRNAYLDAEESEDDLGQEIDSETEELKKGGRATKRRRIGDDSDDGDGSGEEEQDAIRLGDVEDHEQSAATPEPSSPRRHDKDDSDHAELDTKGGLQSKKPKLSGAFLPLAKKNLVNTDAAVRKSGVVYISRVPPFMKPAKLRSLLEPYGKINHIFLSPEDLRARSRRVRNGGNKKRTYTDGWVEFVSKRDAKKACELLNAQTIGGKKGTYYRDDIWSLLYLKGFKWHHLTQQINAEIAERASRMQAEISKTKKETEEYLRNVEMSKMVAGMEAKRAAKGTTDVTGNDDGGEKPGLKARGVSRSFQQTAVAKGKEQMETTAPGSKLFGKIF